MTLAGALILGVLGFYIGAEKGWLSQQREELKEPHDFYRAKIEEEVLRAKKLEAVSRLAGGITMISITYSRCFWGISPW